MNNRHLVLIATAIAAVATGAAQANTVVLSNITATWYDGSPVGNVTYAGNGTTAPQARWGTGAQQSGYDFIVEAQTFSFSVPPSPTPNQVLGEFTHLNYPIDAGTSITDIKLKITADVVINGGGALAKIFNYDFDHFETDNGANPCANGGANGSGVNGAGCADRVKANWSSTSQDFLVGPDVYTLNVMGFSLTRDGLNPFTEFWTAENNHNHAYLLANVALRSEVENVPEPGSIALIGMALAGLVAVRRMKPAKV